MMLINHFISSDCNSYEREHMLIYVREGNYQKKVDESENTEERGNDD